MRVTLDSTSRLVDVIVDRVAVPARVWEGETDSGIRVIALITRIAVRRDADTTQFEHELLELREPSPDGLAVFPARLVL